MFIISVGYKGTLLSMLVKKEYEQPIDTVQHLVEDGRPLYIAAKTSIFSALRDDSRESVQLIMKAQSKSYETLIKQRTNIISSLRTFKGITNAGKS